MQATDLDRILREAYGRLTLGDEGEALALFDKAEEQARAAGDTSRASQATLGLAEVAALLGHGDTATQLYKEAAHLAEQAGDLAEARRAAGLLGRHLELGAVSTATEGLELNKDLLDSNVDRTVEDMPVIEYGTPSFA